MKKRFWLLALCLVSLLLVLTGCGSEKKPTEDGKQVLNIFSWADNFDPEMIKAFEKKYNCRVNYDVFANNEELLAKIQAGGAQYDLIQPSDYMVSTMIKLGKVYGNLMVDLKATNQKLAERSLRIVMEATGCDRQEAAAALGSTGGHAKLAIFTLLSGLDAESARQKLAAADGYVARALADLKQD